MTDDELKTYLADNGYPRHVVEAGRQGLVDRYRKFVEQVEHGYRLGLEDYRNDLDLRGVLSLAGLDMEVTDLDRRLDAMLTTRGVRVWETNDDQPFWDFGYPKNASGELREDLEAEGLWDEAAP